MQNNACTGQPGEGGGEKGEKKKPEKADAQRGGRAFFFFPLFEISDVNRKTTEATCKIYRVL